MSSATVAPTPSARPASIRSAAPAVLPGPEYYEPVLDPQFPRTAYNMLEFYSDPANCPQARMLWRAARRVRQGL
jgi:hypothetical protein